MITAESIKKIISENLSCSHLEVDGDGHHWYAVIVAESFAGLRSVQRHQNVYALLKQQIDSNQLHALSLRTYTATEWQSKQA